METINILNIAAVPVITVICFLAAECAKLTPMKDNWLPALCGLIGGALGAAAMYVSPELVPATDIFTAIAIGIVSGLPPQVYTRLENSSLKWTSFQP